MWATDFIKIIDIDPTCRIECVKDPSEQICNLLLGKNDQLMNSWSQSCLDIIHLYKYFRKSHNNS